MVNLYLFKPAHKLRVLSDLLFKTSKQALRTSLSKSPAPFVNPLSATQPSGFNLNVLDLAQAARQDRLQGSMTRDVDYYKHDRESGMCIFRVENTLFKVHKCFLVREPCAFGDMFSLPCVEGRVEGQCDDAAIPLSDTAEQFRDLLWALYAIPAQLLVAPGNDLPSLQRLLNIALLANKYCIASYEAWALDRLFCLAQSPSSFLRYESSTICSQVLEISVLCGHQGLVDVTTHRLITRILWSDFDRRPIYCVAESWGLTKLQSVVYYRDITDLERQYAGHLNAEECESVFIANIPDERQRSHLYSAYQSLVTLWERVRQTPPSFLPPPGDCVSSSHTHCIEAWGKLWTDAASSPQTLQLGSSDVLGRLKAMMFQLKRMLLERDNIMCLDCSMTALESVTATKDLIILDLSNHFKL